MKVVVISNGALDFVELKMKAAVFLDFGVELKNSNFAAMAASTRSRLEAPFSRPVAFYMTPPRRDKSLWWVAEAILLAISCMAALMLLSLVLTRFLHWLGQIGDYSIAELYLDDGETSVLALTCGVFVPIILVLLPKIWRRG